jgi:Flp pilus assembly protein TadD
MSGAAGADVGRKPGRLKPEGNPRVTSSMLQAIPGRSVADRPTRRLSRMDRSGPRRPMPLGAVMVALLLVLAGCQSRQQPQPGVLSLESRLRLAGTLDAGQGGNGAATVAVLQEAVAQRPQDATLQDRLSLAAEHAGAYGEAAQATRAAMAVQGPSLPRLLALGRLELQKGDPAAAVEAFRQAGTLAPGNAAAFGGLGLSHDMAGDHAAAQDAYRSALAIAPQNWTVRSNLALSQVLSRQTKAAATTLAEAEYAPGAPRQARHNLALALAASGETARATRVLRLDMGPVEATAMVQELTAVAELLDPSVVASQPPALRPVVSGALPGPRATPARGRAGLPGVTGGPAR